MMENVGYLIMYRVLKLPSFKYPYFVTKSNIGNIKLLKRNN